MKWATLQSPSISADTRTCRARMRRVLTWLYGHPYFLLTLTMLMWGGNAVASRLAVGEVSPLTFTFLRWLGVNVAPETEREILGAAQPLAQSIRICRDNLRRILDGKYAASIPLGMNVESVSINRDEIDASVELFQVLSETLAGR